MDIYRKNILKLTRGARANGYPPVHDKLTRVFFSTRVLFWFLTLSVFLFYRLFFLLSSTSPF